MVIKNFNKNLVQYKAEKSTASIKEKTLGSSMQKSKPAQASKHLEDTLRDSKGSKQLKDSFKEPGRRLLSDLISQVLSEKILKEFSQELGGLRFENDVCLSVFTECHMINAKCIIALIQELSKIKDDIIDMALVNVSDALYFFTMFVLMMRKLTAYHPGFTSIIDFILSVIAVLLNEPREDPYSIDLMRNINIVVLPKLIEIVKEDPSKVKHISQIVMALYFRDKKEKISAINIIRNALEQEPQLMYSMISALLEEQKEYDEEIFDVFLYYAIIGLQHSSSYVECYSLHMLNQIAQYSHDEIFTLIPKFELLGKAPFWEVKVQLVMLCATLLLKTEHLRELLKPEDAARLTKSINEKVQNEKNVTKEKLEALLVLIESTLTEKAPFSVLKIGMIYIMPLLNIYRRLYSKFTELLVIIPEQLRIQLLEETNTKAEMQRYSYGKYALSYPISADTSKIDKLFLLKTLCEQINNSQLEHLEKEHVAIIMVCIKVQVLVSEMDTWLKLYKGMKDYLFIALLDKDISSASYEILMKFFGITALIDKIVEESGDIVSRALELIYPEEKPDVDTQKQFSEFIKEKVDKGNRQIKDMFANAITKFKVAKPQRNVPEFQFT